MKKLLLTLSITFAFFANKAQTTFWTETFGTNPVCATVVANNTNPSGNGTWTVVSTGTNDLLGNIWYISTKESGNGVGTCGADCTANPTLTSRSLHVSTHSLVLGDVGAAYSAGPGLSDTDLRAQSPTINCTGKNSISLNMTYLMWGIVNQDYMQVQYSPDNGVTWSNLGIPPQTPTNTCAGQGLWTSYSVALPASANNNATVKIGFRWQNVSASGADPSVAIDDVALTYSAAAVTSLVPTFTLQTSICKGDSTQITANTGTTVATGYTWTANPAGPIFSAANASVTYVKFNTTGTYSVILTAASGTQVVSVNHTITVNPTPIIGVSSTTLNVCVGNSATLTATGGISYTWTPGSTTGSSLVASPTVNTTYVCTGTGSFSCKSSTLLSITVATCTGGGAGLNAYTLNDHSFSIYPNPLTDKMTLLAGENLNNVKVEMTDVLGKKLLSNDYNSIPAGTTQVINTSTLPKGIYFVNVKANGIEKAPIKVIKE